MMQKLYKLSILSLFYLGLTLSAYASTIECEEAHLSKTGQKNSYIDALKSLSFELLKPTLGPVLSLQSEAHTRIWIKGPEIKEIKQEKKYYGVLRYIYEGAYEWISSSPFPLETYFDNNNIKNIKDFVGIVDLALKPGKYQYQCGYIEAERDYSAEDWSRFRWPENWETFDFKINPPQENLAVLKDPTAIAFGSCRYFVKIINEYCGLENSDEIFEYTVNKLKKGKSPDLFLMLGDQIYADSLGIVNYCMKYSKYTKLYNAAFSTPNFKKLLASVPIQFMGDDHEIYNNLIVNDHLDKEYVQAGLAAYRTYQAIHYPTHSLSGNGTPKGGFALTVRDIPLYIMDTRFQRSSDPKKIVPDEELEKVKQWLLAKKTSSYKVIASGVPFFPGCSINSKEDSDKWLGFKDQLNDMLQFIDREKIEGIVFLGGDIHAAHYAQIRTPGGIILTQLISSPFHWGLRVDQWFAFHLQTEHGYANKEFLPGYPFIKASKVYRVNNFGEVMFLGDNKIRFVLRDEKGKWINKEDPIGYEWSLANK